MREIKSTTAQYFVPVMVGKVLNIKVCNPLKLRSGLLAKLREAPFGRLTGNFHAICHYSNNLPLNQTAFGR